MPFRSPAGKELLDLSTQRRWKLLKGVDYLTLVIPK